MYAPAKLPMIDTVNTSAKDISPLEIKTPAGGKITSLGNGMKELSISIPKNIPKYPKSDIIETTDSIKLDIKLILYL